jgi:hypothetical protein
MGGRRIIDIRLWRHAPLRNHNKAKKYFEKT